MSEHIKHTIYSHSDCLSEKTLFDYIDNKLSQKERHIVEKHLLDCELCSDALEGLELTKDRARITLIKEEINKRILSTTKEEAKVVAFNYKLVFSIAATIALLVVGVFFFNKINLKEATMSGDMAELKETESPAQNSVPPPPPPSPLEEAPATVTVTEATKEESGNAISELKAEGAKPAPNKVAMDQELTVNEKQKAGDYYKQTEVTAQESKNQAVTLNDEVTTVGGTVAFGATTPADDRKVDKLENTVSAPQSTTFEREKDAKKDGPKKAEEKGAAGSGAETYAWSTPDQNNKQQNSDNRTSTATNNPTNNNTNAAQNNTISSGETIDLAKNTGKGKDGTFRSENKPEIAGKKSKKIADKEESRADEDGDISLDGAVGYEPESIKKEKEKLKSADLEQTDATTKTVAVADSIVAGLATVEEMPEYPGGDAALNKFIHDNFKYNNEQFKANEIISNKIYVQFTVTEDGSVKNPKIIKGINTVLDNEAIRVVKLMPKWKPVVRGGKATSTIMNLPIKLEFK